MRRLDAELIPAGPINEMHEVFADPHVAARGIVIEQPLADHANSVRLIGNPIHFSRTPIRYDRPPPSLGAHTEEILLDRMGMSQSEFGELLAQGVASKSE